MKKLVCDNCGSPDIVAQDGILICQACGSKFIPEKSEKKVFKNRVASKTSHDDTSIEELLECAKEKYKEAEYGTAEGISDKIINLDPRNAEAWFIKGVSILNRSNKSKIFLEEFFTCIEKVMDLVSEENKLFEYASEAHKAYINFEYTFVCDILLSQDICDAYDCRPHDIDRHFDVKAQLAMNRLRIQNIYDNRINTLPLNDDRNVARNLQDDIGKDLLEWVGGSQDRLINHAEIAGIEKGWQTVKLVYDQFSHSDRKKFDKVVNAYSLANNLLTVMIPNDLMSFNKNNKAELDLINRVCDVLLSITEQWEKILFERVKGTEKDDPKREEIVEKIKQAKNDIKKYAEVKKACDPSHKDTKGGCYIATAVYGSYDCPEVWTLRRFRDNTLAKTWYGTAFIHLYYKVSPTLVKWFGNTTWFKRFFKSKLNCLVSELQKNGVENTPYKDRVW